MNYLWVLLGLVSPSVGESLVMQAPLEAAASAPVFAFRNGVVKQVFGQTGDRVAAGDTLALLDDQVLRLEEETAQLALQKVQQRLTRTRALHASGGISVQDVEALAFEVRTAQIRCQKARMEREKTVIVASMSGLLSECGIQAGEQVAAGKVCFRIIDPEDLKAELFVAVDRLAWVKLGQRVMAQSPASPELRLQGTVVRISPVVDPESGRCAVRVCFPGAGARLKPGTVVDVTLTKE